MPDERTFTFKECCGLLKINPKSFLEWLKKARIDPKAQVDKFDPRKKYLTTSQLLMLAEAHGRVLPSLDDDVEQPNEVTTIEVLAEQLAAFQQRFDQVDQVLAQIVAFLQEIGAQQRELQAFPEQTQQRFDQLQLSLKEVVAPFQEVLPENSDLHNNGTQQARQHEETELVMVPASSSPPVKASPVKRQDRSTKAKPSAKKKKTVRGKKLPAGLVLLRDFAGLHHVVTERASAAGKSGKIKVTQGKWLVNSRWATEALDVQGQHDFYEVFHEREDFTSCEQCPHHLAS